MKVLMKELYCLFILFVMLINLDNFRVKEEEDLETTIYVSYDEVIKKQFHLKYMTNFIIKN